MHMILILPLVLSVVSSTRGRPSGLPSLSPSWPHDTAAIHASGSRTLVCTNANGHTNAGSVSGQTPEVPVVSKKSGHVYEKRLILKYIDAEGKVRERDAWRGKKNMAVRV